MNKKNVMILAICFVFVAVYPSVLRHFYPEYGKTAKKESIPAASSSSPAPRAAVTAAVAAVDPLVSERTPVETDKYIFGIAQSNGAIARIFFKDHYDYEHRDALKFLESKDDRHGIGAIEYVVNGKSLKPTIVGMDGGAYGQEGPRIQLAAADSGFKMEAEWIISNSSYNNELRIKFVNESPSEARLRVAVSAGSGLYNRNSIDSQYFEANWITDNSVAHIHSPGVGKTKIADKNFIAASIKNRHFSSILKPHASGWIPEVTGLGKKPGEFVSLLRSPEIIVAPGQSWNESMLVYIGPNASPELKPLGLDAVVNFGKFDSICKLFLGAFQLVNGVVHNHGLAVILLTLFLNVLMLPLTKTSFMSMKRMQLIQPEMAKLRERHGKDPVKLNKEMTELYKKYKVNPMGGCLPMVLQMPIFISLYVMLSKATELIGSKFLWVNDLSSPDFIWLPFTLPVIGNTLHILPLVMVAAMFLQQKMYSPNMAAQDPTTAQTQKMMAWMMPIFFGFIMYPMPAALVLYWLTNTITMAAYQWHLKRLPLAV